MNKKYNTEEERKKGYNDRFKRYKAKKKAERNEAKRLYYEEHKEEIETEKQKKYEDQIEKIKYKYHNDKKFRAKHLVASYKHFDNYYFYNQNKTITPTQLLELWDGGCIYCGETDWHKLGADRIDNNKPHSIDNCVCCCSQCNNERQKKDFQTFYNQKVKKSE